MPRDPFIIQELYTNYERVSANAKLRLLLGLQTAENI
jgi:hypothetical protein